MFQYRSTLMLRTKRQSAQMSKITNDRLTRSVTGCFVYSCTHMATVGVNELILDKTTVEFQSMSCLTHLLWLKVLIPLENHSYCLEQCKKSIRSYTIKTKTA